MIDQTWVRRVPMAIGHRLTMPTMALVSAGALLLAATACSDDGGEQDDSSDDTVAADVTEDLLGPDDPASGEPVKIGMVSDGATEAYDNTDELRAAEATAAYYNEHRAGVGGRPIEMVTCQTLGAPSTAGDCANQLIADEVVAVGVAPTSVLDPLWQRLHDGGIPTFLITAAGEQYEQDEESTFIVYNPLSSLALSVAVAEASGADRIGVASIDVPQAVEAMEGPGADMLDKAGLDWDLYRIPIGTPDMTSQMQELASSGAGVAQVLGNDAFCIAAFQGLEAVAYDGEISAIGPCITDATREAMPGQLEGLNVLSNYATGATDDPSYQLYLAVMEAYGDAVTDIDNDTSLNGYAISGALFNALADASGEITAETAGEAIKTMDAAPLPAAGDITFQCGGAAYAAMPAVCTNQYLRAQLDADGLPSSYTLEDSSDVLP
jgi:branched-chain amino acid transport system substrate-binding protein